MNMMYRKKLLYIIFVINIFIVVSFGVITSNYNYNLLRDKLFLNAKQQSIQIDNYVSDLISQSKEDLMYLYEYSRLYHLDSSIKPIFSIDKTKISKKYSQNTKGLEKDIYFVLNNYRTTHSEIPYVYLGTKWGGYVQSPDGVKINAYDPRKRPWYIAAAKKPNSVVVTAPYISYGTKEEYEISVAKAIKDSKGNITGVIGIDINLANISKLMKQLNLSANGYPFIILKDGTIVAHPNKKLNFKNIKNLSTKGAAYSDIKFVLKDYKKLLKEKNSQFETMINGKPVLINLCTSKKLGYKIVDVVEKSQLVKEANGAIYYIAFVALVIILLSAIFIIGLTKKLTEPIGELMQVMEMVGGGNLDIRTNIKSKDEFGKLGEYFNKMLDKLRSSFNELTMLYDQLASNEEEIRAQYDQLQYNQEILRKSEERYRLTIEGSNDAIWEIDLLNGECFLSDKFYEMTGYSPDSSRKIMVLFDELVNAEDKIRAKEDFLYDLENNIDYHKSEMRLRAADGSYIWIYNKGKILRDSNGNAIKIAGSTTDITERKDFENKILHMAQYDSLTNLPNRDFFISMLSDEIGSCLSNDTIGAMIFVDIDNFKNINDTMGHTFGDKLLCNVSRKLTNTVNKENVVGRLGGDEFGVIYASLSEKEIMDFADKLLCIFKEPIILDQKKIYITSSIGIAIYPKHGTDVNNIIKNADAAMHKAKELGKKKAIVYDEEIIKILKRKTQIERVLRNAIANNELIVYYQPQYITGTREIYGFEALLRLNSKELGFISPAEFIPIAEESGYIKEIGQWVFKEACRQSHRWQEKGYKFRSMSINVSSVQVYQSDFFDMIIDTIKDTKVSVDTIELELTETVLMESIDSYIKLFRKLMDYGLRIALDDFGTGYSSLNYLRKIPLSTLKVDKSFIDNIASNEKEDALIKNIIEMAHSMDLEVVAEGVENQQQFEFLESVNCNYIQGYYLGRPLSVDDAEKLLESYV